MLNSLQKQKKIIIADAEPDSRVETIEYLQARGFHNLAVAADGNQIYEMLRAYQHDPELLGLVIIDEKLPHCQIKELCEFLSHEDEGIFLPFIVLVNEQSKNKTPALESECQRYELVRPYLSAELLMLVEFLLVLKDERFLRYKQKEELISQLAARKLLDAKLEYLVVHDDLTGLLNRRNLEQHLYLVLHEQVKFRQNGVLLFIDLDRFGLINDLEGFDAADRLLIEVVAVIKRAIQAKGLFARVGSDELCLYLENSTFDNARVVAEHICKRLDEFRFAIGNVCYHITASIGIASLKSSKTVKHPGELISRAHQACAIAKSKGRNRVWQYCEDDQAFKERQRDIHWLPLIRDALLNDRFFLVFQPVVGLFDGEISHYEVLIRMRDGDECVIDPGEFIPVAERMGLIHGIDAWVVDKAIDFLTSLPQEFSHIKLAINLSCMAFQDDSIAAFIRQKLDRSWVSGDRLTFEITETAAVGNFEQTLSTINQIRALGCHIALDDFGAGFCSFNYLKIFPAEYVKIDGQFIQNLVNDETDQMLVRSMQQIARKLGKKTIAEYVECPQTIKILREIGINYGQGSIFGKPLEQLSAQSAFRTHALTESQCFS
ncbi:EAL domain-containing protein [Methylobacter luteus]|uniref:EAL domain-containing protein n=1 Tax=Methylobacter luteus TaxID=415 RepID=UPI0003F55C52|nr:EAL domain-containing protein [Methylobacter luteus]